MHDFDKIFEFIEVAKRHKDPRLESVASEIDIVEGGAKELMGLLGVSSPSEAIMRATAATKLLSAGGMSEIKASAATDNLHKVAFIGGILKGISLGLSFSEILKALPDGALGQLVASSNVRGGISSHEAKVLNKIYSGLVGEVKGGKHWDIDTAARRTLGEADGRSFVDLYKRHPLDIQRGVGTKTIGSRVVGALGSVLNISDMPSKDWRHLPFRDKIIPVLRIVSRLLPAITKIALAFGGMYAIYRGYKALKKSEVHEGIGSGVQGVGADADKDLRGGKREDEIVEQGSPDFVSDIYKFYQGKK